MVPNMTVKISVWDSHWHDNTSHQLLMLLLSTVREGKTNRPGFK